jgi:hypothetical protein
MSKYQHISTSVDISPVQYPKSVQVQASTEDVPDGSVSIELEGIINPRGGDKSVTVFANTSISMTRPQAHQLLTALYLSLSGAGKPQPTEGRYGMEGWDFFTFEREELDEGNPITLLNKYAYDEASALAQWDAYQDEASL